MTSDFISNHLAESKAQIEKVALEFFTHMDESSPKENAFGDALEDAGKWLVKDSLINIANERIKDLEGFIGENDSSQEYADNLESFINEIIKARV